MSRVHAWYEKYWQPRIVEKTEFWRWLFVLVVTCIVAFGGGLDTPILFSLFVLLSVACVYG